MKVFNNRPLIPRSLAASLLSSVLLLTGAGCGDDEEIAVYEVPRDVSASPHVESTVAEAKPAPPAPSEVAPIQWTVPAGWKALPSQAMRYASFAVSPADPSVVLTVIPLPRDANPLLPNINRWEAQVGLPPTAEADLAKVVKQVELSPGVKADVVDLVGKDPGTQKPTRMLAAIVPHGSTSWFIKLLGPAEVVGEQKENFDAFVRSLRFTDIAQGSGSAPQPPAEMKLTWEKLPEGWTQAPNTQQFRLHTIKVQAGDAAADLAITRMVPAQAGDLMANINRWRQAVGLEATTDPAAHPPREVRIGGRPGVIFEVAGSGNDVLVGMTEAGGQFYFFKLQGPTPVVQGQKAAFEQFLQSVKFVGEQR